MEASALRENVGLYQLCGESAGNGTSCHAPAMLSRWQGTKQSFIIQDAREWHAGREALINSLHRFA